MLSEEEYLQKWLDAYIQARNPQSSVDDIISINIQNFLKKCGSNGTYSFRMSIPNLAEYLSNLIGLAKTRVFLSGLKMVSIVCKMAELAKFRSRYIIPLEYREEMWDKESVDRMVRRAQKFSDIVDQIRSEEDIVVPYRWYNTDIMEAIRNKQLDKAIELALDRKEAYTQYAHGFSYVLDQEDLPVLVYTTVHTTTERYRYFKVHEYTSFAFDENDLLTTAVPRLL